MYLLVAVIILITIKQAIPIKLPSHEEFNHCTFRWSTHAQNRQCYVESTTVTKLSGP